MSEPAILVKRGNSSQVWSMEKLENKIIDMREIYDEQMESNGVAMVRKYFKYTIFCRSHKNLMDFDIQ